MVGATDKLNSLKYLTDEDTFIQLSTTLIHTNLPNISI